MAGKREARVPENPFPEARETAYPRLAALCAKIWADYLRREREGEKAA